ncbi:MAG: DUF2961 domain-containing protein [Planctomycetes bacterium]|nr:DUF2961 domain-containing protein [Planctomycetota bacterium]
MALSYHMSGRRQLLVAILCFLAGLGLVDAAAQTVDPVGVGAMVDLENLPALRGHTVARQVSSHDPTGGNDDGFFSVNFRYYDALRREYVLLEESGAGCIYRIQMADLRSYFGPPVRLRIYLDGAATPQVDREVTDFFSGSGPPFLAPLVGASHPGAGGGFGHYCYVPIPFRAGARVALTGLVHFYNITYHRYRDGIGTVPAFGRDRSVAEIITLWQAAGSRPTPVRTGERTAQVPLVLGPHSTLTVLDIPGAGVISGLEFTPPQTSGPSPSDLDELRLQARWDHEPSPSIDVPFSLLFATGNPPSPANGLLLGTLPNQRHYCYLPMPFWQRAWLRVENRGAATVSLTARVTFRVGGAPSYDPARTGYLRCAVRSADPVLPGRDYIALAAGGRGHVAAVVLETEGKDFFNFDSHLEGDERIAVDFERTPSCHGNGTEDFFNAAYYFLGQTFSRPLHGSPFRAFSAHENRRLSYRLFAGDAPPFGAHIRLGFEVGGFSHLRGRYRSAVLYYHRPEPALGLADRLNVGDGADEARHGWTTDGTPVGPLSGAYEGDQDDVVFADRGVHLERDRSCAFHVTIPPHNDGCLLRRRLDYLNEGIADQTLEVEVDGHPVGTWSVPGHYLNHLAAFPSLPASRGQGTPDKRWLDSDFEIPAAFTRDRGAVEIRLTNTGPGPANAFDFRMFAHLSAPAADVQPPGAPLHLTAVGLTTDAVVLTWNEAADDTGIDRYEVWRVASTALPAAKIGEALGTRYVDRHADPAVSPWYYSVRAVDSSGNVGPFAGPVVGSPGRVLHFECEELLPALRSPSGLAGQLDLALFPQLGRLWSGDNQVLFVGNRHGDWISFAIPVTRAGRYELKLACTSFVGTSSFEVLIDEQPAGPPVHHPLRMERREAIFGPHYLAAGVHSVKIRLIEGPAVYSGTQVALDCITLTPK